MIKEIVKLIDKTKVLVIYKEEIGDNVKTVCWERQALQVVSTFEYLVSMTENDRTD